jgi:Fur family ferric uptake transcriptional regulator
MAAPRVGCHLPACPLLLERVKAAKVPARRMAERVPLSPPINFFENSLDKDPLSVIIAIIVKVGKVAETKIQRNTRQRTVLLEELRKLSCHPTAAKLYEIARARMPKISLGTIYRNLDLLAQSGVIQKLHVGGAEARFDGNPEQHHHVRCIHCERVDDVHDLPEDFVKGQVQTLAGYDIVDFRLDFLGICPDCQGGCRAGGGGALPQERE